MRLISKFHVVFFAGYQWRSPTHLIVSLLFRKFNVAILLLLIIGIRAFSQQLPPNSVPQNAINPIDLIDVIRKELNKKGQPRSDSTVQGVRNLSLLPIVGYGPANGFVIGAAIGVTNLLGNQKTTELSSMLLSLSFTTKQQILVAFRSDIHLPDNKWYIPGDIRLLFFSQPTYGLGIYELNSPVTFNLEGINVSKNILEQPMRFNYIRVYETIVKEVFRHWYAGLGINIDVHGNINDESLKLDTPNQVITSNYFYSTKYGFNPAHYSTNGLSLQIIQDSRDNPISAHKGYYANLSFRVNEQIFGGSQNSTMLYYEWRNYIGLDKRKPAMVLAFWAWGEFVTSGNVPYLALPSITWDTYNRSGRGYIQGRFRGKDMMYEEAEYRLPISRNGLLGAVAFFNLTTASNPITSQTLFYSVAPGYGFGLRINMNKKDRTNICIDYGRGQSSSGIYFNIRETF
ncbi:MAG TPA: BamA/TamA family outer membrane protein [Puia sp.]|nr:BamA/TamA family outer membrane protein [Puia sp.]